MAALFAALFIAFWLLHLGLSNVIPSSTVNNDVCSVVGKDPRILSVICVDHANPSNIINKIMTAGYVRCPSSYDFWHRSIKIIEFIACNCTDYPIHFLKHFDNAELVDLSSNQIARINGSSLENLLSLQTLKLSSNRIMNVSIDDFHGLTQLTQLDLQYNNIEHIPVEAFMLLTHLRHLNLSHNQIQSIAISIFNDRNVLQKLDLSFNRIIRVHPNAFMHLTHLTYLNMSHSQMIYIKSDTFSSLVNLEILDLSSNRLMKFELPVNFGKFCRFYLDNNNFTESSKHFVESISKRTLVPTIDQNSFKNIKFNTDPTRIDPIAMNKLNAGLIKQLIKDKVERSEDIVKVPFRMLDFDEMHRQREAEKEEYNSYNFRRLRKALGGLALFIVALVKLACRSDQSDQADQVDQAIELGNRPTLDTQPATTTFLARPMH